MWESKIFKILLVAFFAVFTVSILSITKSSAQYNSTAVPMPQDIFKTLPGKNSAYMILPNGQTIGQNEDAKLPAYSTIKLWVAAAVLAASENGSLNLEESESVTNSNKVTGTGHTTVGSKYTYDQYLEYMLTYSDNTA